MHDQETIADLAVCFGDLIGIQEDNDTAYLTKVVKDFDLIDHLHWALQNCQIKTQKDCVWVL